MNIEDADERSPHTVNAVCVDLEDLGFRDTPGGKKHQIKLWFETDEQTELGEPRFVTRTYNLNMHEWSLLRRDIESWLEREFTDEEAKEFKVITQLNKQCQLELVPFRKDDRFYWNIGKIKPSKVHVTSNYKRSQQ